MRDIKKQSKKTSINGWLPSCVTLLPIVMAVIQKLFLSTFTYFNLPTYFDHFWNKVVIQRINWNQIWPLFFVYYINRSSCLAQLKMNPADLQSSHFLPLCCNDCLSCDYAWLEYITRYKGSFKNVKVLFFHPPIQTRKSPS